MKHLIRNNTFETNSSSMHTLVIPAETNKKEINLNNISLSIKLTDATTEGFDTSGAGSLDSIKSILTYIWTGITMSKEWGLCWVEQAENNLREWLPNCKFIEPKNENSYNKINHQSNECLFIKDILQDKELFTKTLKQGVIHLLSDSCSFPDDTDCIYIGRG